MFHCGTIVSDCTLSGPSASRSWRGRIADDTISCIDIFRNSIAIGTLSGNILFSEVQRVHSRYKAVIKRTVGRLEDSAPHAPANVLKYSPCGSFLAMGTIKGDVMVMQVSGGCVGAQLKILYLQCVHPQGSVLSLAWSHDSCRLYSGCTKGVVHEHVNESSAWTASFSFAASMLGAATDRVLSRFNEPITSIGYSSFTIPNSTNKTDVLIISVNNGICLCYSMRNQTTSPWKSPFIPSICGQSLLFSSALGYGFEPSVGASSVRKVTAICTELLLSLQLSGSDDAGGCGVECSNLAVYDIKTALKMRNETIYQSVYSTTSSKLAHTNKVKLRDDFDITAFSQLVPMQADDKLSIFFGVTSGNRLAVVHLNGGCFNVLDLFKYVHKVIVDGSNVYILHSSSASGVMLVDLIRIVFVDLDTNRVAFPLYSYRLHAAIVSLQRLGKKKIHSKKSEKDVPPMSSLICKIENDPPAKPARLMRTEAVEGQSALPAGIVSTDLSSRVKSYELNKKQDLNSVENNENFDHASSDHEVEIGDWGSFMKETSGTWLEQWCDDKISFGNMSSDWTSGIRGNRSISSASGEAKSMHVNGSSWLQNAYTSGSYLLSVPYGAANTFDGSGKWIKASPLEQILDENVLASTVKARLCAKRRCENGLLVGHGVNRRSVRFPENDDRSERSEDVELPVSTKLDMLSKVDEFLAFQRLNKTIMRNDYDTGISEHSFDNYGGMIRIQDIEDEDFERRTYTVNLPLYASCGTGIKFDLLPDGGLIVIDFVSSVKYRGVAESPYSASCGLINVGDILVGIDGISLTNIGLQAVAKKLQDLVRNATTKKSCMMRFEYGDNKNLAPIGDILQPSYAELESRQTSASTTRSIGGSASISQNNHILSGARQNRSGSFASSISASHNKTIVMSPKRDFEQAHHCSKQLFRVENSKAPSRIDDDDSLNAWDLGYSDREDAQLMLFDTVMADTVHNALIKRSVYGECGVMTCQAGPFQHLIERDSVRALEILADNFFYWRCRVFRSSMSGFFRGSCSTSGKRFSRLLRNEVYMLPTELNASSSGKDFRRCLILQRKVEYFLKRSKKSKIALKINKSFGVLMPKLYSKCGKLFLKPNLSDATESFYKFANCALKYMINLAPPRSDLLQLSALLLERLKQHNERSIEIWLHLFELISLCNQVLIYSNLVDAAIPQNKNLELYSAYMLRAVKKIKAVLVSGGNSLTCANSGDNSSDLDELLSSNCSTADETDFSKPFDLDGSSSIRLVLLGTKSTLQPDNRIEMRLVAPRLSAQNFKWAQESCQAQNISNEVFSPETVTNIFKIETKLCYKLKDWLLKWLLVHYSAGNSYEKGSYFSRPFIPISQPQLLLEIESIVISQEKYSGQISSITDIFPIQLVPLTLITAQFCCNFIMVVNAKEPRSYFQPLLVVLEIWLKAIRPTSTPLPVASYREIYFAYTAEHVEYKENAYSADSFVVIIEALLSLRWALTLCPCHVVSIMPEKSHPNLHHMFDDCLGIFGVKVSASSSHLIGESFEVSSSMINELESECSHLDFKLRSADNDKVSLTVPACVLLKIYSCFYCHTGLDLVIVSCEENLLKYKLLSTANECIIDDFNLSECSHFDEVINRLNSKFCEDHSQLNFNLNAMMLALIVVTFKRLCSVSFEAKMTFDFSSIPSAQVLLRQFGCSLYPVLSNFHIQRFLMNWESRDFTVTETTLSLFAQSLMTDKCVSKTEIMSRLAMYSAYLNDLLFDSDKGLLFVDAMSADSTDCAVQSLVSLLFGLSVLIMSLTMQLEKNDYDKEVIDVEDPSIYPIFLCLNPICCCGDTNHPENLVAKSGAANRHFLTAKRIIEISAALNFVIGAVLLKICIDMQYLSGLIAITEGFVCNCSTFIGQPQLDLNRSRMSSGVSVKNPVYFLELSFDRVNEALDIMLDMCITVFIKMRRLNISSCPSLPSSINDKNDSMNSCNEISAVIETIYQNSNTKGGTLEAVYSTASAVGKTSIEAVNALKRGSTTVGKCSLDAVSAVGKAIMPSGLDDSLHLLRSKTNQKIAIQAVSSKMKAVTTPKSDHSESYRNDMPKLKLHCPNCTFFVNCLVIVVKMLKSLHSLRDTLHPDSNRISVSIKSRARFLEKTILARVSKLISELKLFDSQAVSLDQKAIDDYSANLLFFAIKDVKYACTSGHND